MLSRVIRDRAMGNHCSRITLLWLIILLLSFYAFSEIQIYTHFSRFNTGYISEMVGTNSYAIPLRGQLFLAHPTC
jgi:hypothetical protein